MKYILQNILFCGLLTIYVKLNVLKTPLGGLFFYPKPVQERAFALGLADRESMSKRSVISKTALVILVAVYPVLCVRLWSGIDDFPTAFWQIVLMLWVLNWYDGIVIDEVWVRYSRFWAIPEIADIPYVKSWPYLLKERGIMTALYVPIGVALALIAVKL